MSFKVGRGWSIPEETADHLLLRRAPEPRDEAIYLDSSKADLSVGEALEFMKETFVGTTGRAKDISFSDPEPVGIDEFSGRGLTMVSRADQLVVTVNLGTEAYEVRPGDKLHLNAVHVNGRTPLLFVEAPGDKFKAFLEEAGAVLRSLDF